jgi:hypothetical protein
VHFLGAAAVTAFCFDAIRVFRPELTRRARVWSAAAIAIGAAVMWEAYEFAADQLFLTYRHAGRLDTAYDLLFGACGVAAIAVVLSASSRPVPRFRVRYARVHEPSLTTALSDGR